MSHGSDSQFVHRRLMMKIDQIEGLGAGSTWTAAMERLEDDVIEEDAEGRLRGRQIHHSSAWAKRANEARNNHEVSIEMLLMMEEEEGVGGTNGGGVDIRNLHRLRERGFEKWSDLGLASFLINHEQPPSFSRKGAMSTSRSAVQGAGTPSGSMGGGRHALETDDEEEEM